MIIPFIDLKTQYLALQSEINQRMQQVLDHGQYIMGPEVFELEAALADYVGVKHCITVASGTEALLISLMALDIGPGDEVITTPFSFIATAEVIVLSGATPVFVDIEKTTGNLDANLLEQAVTPRTKAIMPVSLYGQPADMDKINQLAERHGLAVIEDAAQSFGASFQGKRSGGLSTIGCTSFFPSKPLGCYGDGGAIFTNREDLALACKEIRVHGQSQRYVHTRIGVGGRMDTLQCAIVLAKLKRFDWEVERRQAVADRYSRLLSPLGIQLIEQKPGRASVYAQYTLITEQRDSLKIALETTGIPTAIHYPLPINQQIAYKRYDIGQSTPQAEYLSSRVLSLPMGPDLSPQDQDKIIAALAAWK